MGFRERRAPFDVIHAHDWLAANAVEWIKQGRRRKGILTLHSTKYQRCGDNFWGGQSARIRDYERHGTYCADRGIAASLALRGEVLWICNCPDWNVEVIYNAFNAQAFDGWLLNPGLALCARGLFPS